MKTLAMYLPQFHKIIENDQWWGEGFTEWTAVKKAVPIFEGHMQPKEPLHNNYYDLMDKQTMKWQSDLANKYKIHGFCFYHYWFKDGRKILEKPAENLLLWKDIQINFCFCWANEPWARTWSNVVNKNTWAHKFEDTMKLSADDNGLLLEQEYGKESEWKIHFEYLLPFFKDKRYIMKDGKPVINIYNPEQILCLEEMLEKWNEWARDAGMEGIYVIVNNSIEIQWDNVDAYLLHEPAHTRAIFGNELLEDVSSFNNWNRVYSYDKTWAAILNGEYKLDKKIYVGGFVNYDDTPRRSKMGSCFSGVTAEKFKLYFEKLVVKNIKMENEFIFLNAWNEWGEGMYLEPDTDNEYGFLEAIKLVMEKYEDNLLKDIDYRITNNTSISVSGTQSVNEEDLLETNYYQLKKYKEYFDLVNKWLYHKESNKSVKEFFINNKYYKIAIYGMGHLGVHLYSELENTEIKIEYCIDRGITNFKADVPMKSTNDELTFVDAIVITPIMEYQVIKKDLRKRINCPIISLKQVIFEE